MSAALLLLGLVGSCTRDEGSPRIQAVASRSSAKARLRQLSGTVMIKRAAGDDWVSASERMDLFEDDKVRTAPGASAVLEFSNGSFLSLGEEALIAIAQSHRAPDRPRSDVTVLRGRIDAELPDATKQSLSVNTPSATVRAGREIVFQ